MIKEKFIKQIGFKEFKSPYTQQMLWGLGEEEKMFGGTDPIVIYNQETEEALTVRGEFNVIGRKCTCLAELINFVEAIQFLYPDIADDIKLWSEDE